MSILLPTRATARHTVYDLTENKPDLSVPGFAGGLLIFGETAVFASMDNISIIKQRITNRKMSDPNADPASQPPIDTPLTLEGENKTVSVQYALAIFYFLMGILIIIIAAVLPGMPTSGLATFVILGFLIFLAGLIQIFAVPILACKMPPQ